MQIYNLKKQEKTSYGEFWTARQRQSHSIHHSVSYRASFKPELPSYFINRFLEKKGSVVMDPFGGRGTTAIQANLEGHTAIHNDVNPLSLFLAGSRQEIPSIDKIEKKLNSISLDENIPEEEMDEELLNFYHRDTLKEIKNLKKVIQEDKSPEMNMIALAALSRLHGHSPGFFSVYSFPQFSVTPQAQKKNNLKRNLVPEYRVVKPRIIHKLKRDLKNPVPEYYHRYSANNMYINRNAANLGLDGEFVDLVVTSPPFLDKVDYNQDNWLRHWFLDIDTTATAAGISIFKTVNEWRMFISRVIREAAGVIKPGGYFVMEVGEVMKNGKVIPLDETVVEASRDSGLEWFETVVNVQNFTKLSNCWNVSNNTKGTNSNRCVVLRKY